MIHVFVATADKWAAHEPVLEYSIHKHASEPVTVHWLRAGEHFDPHGCTGFTNARWCVPEAARAVGSQYGIYLDVDMLLLADIAELWHYRCRGAVAVLEDGSTEVAVFDASLAFPPMARIHRFKKHELAGCAASLLRPIIPLAWNSEDCVTLGSKLLHFTDLRHQPWFGEHPDRQAVEVLRAYQDEAA